MNCITCNKKFKPSFKTNHRYCGAACRAKDYAHRYPVREQLYNARKRAAKAGIECTLTLDDLPEIPIVCPVFGIPLKRNTKRMADDSISLNRIDSSKGYIKGNVEYISNRANRIINNGTLEEHEAIVRHLKRHPTSFQRTQSNG